MLVASFFSRLKAIGICVKLVVLCYNKIVGTKQIDIIKSISLKRSGDISMKFQIAICDDTEVELNNTKALVEETLKRAGVASTVHTFHDPQDFADNLALRMKDPKNQNPYQVIFLDVVMPNMTGIELGNLVRKYDQNVPVIYTSSLKDYAFDSYSVHAFDYLLKPLEKERLQEALMKAYHLAEKKLKADITIKTKDGLQAVNVLNVTFVESRDRCLHYHLSDGSVVVSIYNHGRFEDSFVPFEPFQQFVQVHKSFLVNMDFIKELQADSISMNDGSVIPISRNQKNNVRSRYLSYFTEGGLV